jgi:hypothetical protein
VLPRQLDTAFLDLGYRRLCSPKRLGQLNLRQSGGFPRCAKCFGDAHAANVSGREFIVKNDILGLPFIGDSRYYRVSKPEKTPMLNQDHEPEPLTLVHRDCLLSILDAAVNFELDAARHHSVAAHHYQRTVQRPV